MALSPEEKQKRIDEIDAQLALIDAQLSSAVGAGVGVGANADILAKEKSKYRPDLGTVPNIARQAISSLTFGTAPKAYGHLGALLNKAFKFKPDVPYEQAYQEIRDIARKSEEQAKQERPVSSFIGDVIGTIPHPFAKTGYLGTIAQGAGYGALHGAGRQDFGVPNQLDESDIAAALHGAVSGGVGSGITKGALEGIVTPALKHVKNRGYGFGKLPKAGATEDKLAHLFEGQREAPNNAALERFERAQQVGVPLTIAEAYRDPVLLRELSMAQQGRKGLLNEIKAKEFKELQDISTQATLQKMRNDMLGGEFRGPGEHLKSSLENMTARRAQEEAVAEAPYKAAELVEAHIKPADTKRIVLSINKKLKDNNLNQVTSPEAYRQLKGIKLTLETDKAPKEIKNPVIKVLHETLGVQDPGVLLPIQKLESVRKDINEKIADYALKGERSEIRKLELIKEGIDEGYDNLLKDKNLDPASREYIETINKARKGWRKYKIKWFNEESREKGAKTLVELMTPRKATEELSEEQMRNIFLGRNGKLKSQALQNIRAYDSVANTMEKRALRAEGLDVLFSPVSEKLGTGEAGGIFLKNIKHFLHNQKELADTLYSPKQQEDILNVGHVFADVYTRPINKTNPSGSADLLYDLIKNFKSLKLIGSLWHKGIEFNQAKIADELLRGRKIPGAKPATERMMKGVIANQVTSNPNDRYEDAQKQLRLMEIEEEMHSIDEQLNKVKRALGE